MPDNAGKQHYKQTDKNPALMKHIIYDRREKVKRINVRYMVHPMVMRIMEKDRNKKGWGVQRRSGGVFSIDWLGRVSLRRGKLGKDLKK